MLNIRSLRNKVEDLETILSQLGNVDVIGLCETWLNKVENIYFNIPGYTSAHCNRLAKKGGGVSFFIRSDWTVDKIHSTDGIHSILVVKFAKRRRI